MSEEKYKPGKVATLDEMNKMAEQIAGEDTRDGLDTQYICKHVCRCICHTELPVTDPLVIYCGCGQCSDCKEYIRWNCMAEHKKRCHQKNE